MSSKGVYDMFNLLIVDDEPLVQIGIKSMLNWQDLGIHICATASNGQEALAAIEEFAPEIVLTDIKMPVMNGLELISICREKHSELPLFIILTSYEEFALIKEAMKYQVLDYLIKLELDASGLQNVIKKALDKLKHLKRLSQLEESNVELPSLEVLRDKFFMRLLHNLFESRQEIELLVKDLHINFQAPYYAVGYCCIQGFDTDAMSSQKQAGLYDSTIQMMKEIADKHITCFLHSLDSKHFCFIFLLDHNDDKALHVMYETLHNSSEMVYKYFNVSVLSSIGRIYDSAFMIADSYQDARQIASFTTKEQPINFFDQLQNVAPVKNAFNISLFKKDIIIGFEEMDAEILYDVFTQLCSLFESYPTAYLQAIDAACNILYLTISLLPQGEAMITEIFEDAPDGYRSIYRQTNILQVIDWLLILRDGLCKKMKERKSSYKNHIIMNVQKYINSHIEEKLTLNDIAFVFGISPNYLSALFKKNSELGFTDYVNTAKIKRAKELLKDSNLKVYEVADQLSFESAFYFSKVFKKIEGISPREYIQQM